MKLSYLPQGRILPDDKLIERVAVAADELASRLISQHPTHLTMRVGRANTLAMVRVSESKHLILRPTTADE